jgi:hypothetical protein
MSSDQDSLDKPDKPVARAVSTNLRRKRLAQSLA